MFVGVLVRGLSYLMQASIEKLSLTLWWKCWFCVSARWRGAIYGAFCGSARGSDVLADALAAIVGVLRQ